MLRIALSSTRVCSMRARFALPALSPQRALSFFSDTDDKSDSNSKPKKKMSSSSFFSDSDPDSKTPKKSSSSFFSESELDLDSTIKKNTNSSSFFSDSDSKPKKKPKTSSFFSDSDDQPSTTSRSSKYNDIGFGSGSNSKSPTADRTTTLAGFRRQSAEIEPLTDIETKSEFPPLSEFLASAQPLGEDIKNEAIARAVAHNAFLNQLQSRPWYHAKPRPDIAPDNGAPELSQTELNTLTLANSGKKAFLRHLSRLPSTGIVQDKSHDEFAAHLDSKAPGPVVSNPSYVDIDSIRQVPAQDFLAQYYYRMKAEDVVDPETDSDLQPETESDYTSDTESESEKPKKAPFVSREDVAAINSSSALLSQIFKENKHEVIPAPESSQAEDIQEGIIFTPTPVRAAQEKDAPEFSRVLELEKEAEELLETEEFHKAESVLFAAIELRRRFFPNEGELAVALLRGAFAAQCVGKRAEAQETYLEALPILKRVYGADNFQVATALANLAEIYAQLEKYDEAIESAKEALVIIEKDYTRESEYYAATISNIGAYQATHGLMAEAKESLETALDIMTRVLGRDNVYTSETLRNYIKVLKDSNLPVELNKVIEEWKENPINNPDFGHMNLSPEFKEKFKKEVASLSLGKKFDPEGFSKGIEVCKEQMDVFMKEWDERYKGFDPDLLEAFHQEVKRIKEEISANPEPSPAV